MRERFASPVAVVIMALTLAASGAPAVSETATPGQLERSRAGSESLPDPLPMQLSVHDAYELAKQGKILLIDIRRPEEWRETGVGEGAKPLTMHQPLPRFIAGIRALSHKAGGVPVALICASGQRTSRMQYFLAGHGINVMDVNAGMKGGWFTRGWIANGLPVQPWSGPAPTE